MPPPLVGKRGRVLLYLAGLDAVYAVSLSAPDANTRRDFVWLAAIAPLWLWACAWALTALVLAWQAFRRRDGIGFAFAIGLKVLWGLVLAGGWLFGGVERGYVSVAIWLATAGLLWSISSWPEPYDPKGAAWTRPPQ